MRASGWIGVSVALLALSGCYFNSSSGEDSWDVEGGGTTAVPDSTRGSDWVYGERTIVIDRGHIAGDMGDVRGFSADTWLSQATDSAGYTSVELQVQDASSPWAAMAMLDITGGITDESIRPGAHFDSASFDSAVQFSVLGCSGSSPGSWDFDQHADEVTVDVSEGSTPNARRFDFTAVWHDTSYGGGGDQVVRGGFEATVDTPDSNLDVTLGAVSGTVAGRTFAGSYPSVAVLSHSDARSSVQVATYEEASLRAVVDVVGGLGNDALVDGAVLEFDLAAHDPLSSALFIAVQSRVSGPDGALEDSRYADKVSVEVRPTASADTKWLAFTATFDTGEQIQGHFQYRLY